MYDTIVNPASSRQVKTTSKLGKKLLHNYEDKFDYVINPETNKIVQSGGKVGQQVLRRYKQKVASTNVSGGGGKKKIKRSGGVGPSRLDDPVIMQHSRPNGEITLNAPREYTCHLKSIGNYSVYETTASKGVSCNNTECSYTGDSTNFKQKINNTNPNDYIMCRDDKSKRKMNFNKRNTQNSWTQAMVGYENENEELIDKFLIDDNEKIKEKWTILKDKTNVKRPIDCSLVGEDKCTTRVSHGKRKFVEDVIKPNKSMNIVSTSPRKTFINELHKKGALNTLFWLRIQSIVEETTPAAPAASAASSPAPAAKPVAPPAAKPVAPPAASQATPPAPVAPVTTEFNQQIEQIEQNIQIDNNEKETHNYVEYVQRIMELSRNTYVIIQTEQDLDLIAKAKNFKIEQLKNFVPDATNKIQQIAGFIDILFEKFLKILSLYDDKTTITDKNDGMYLLLFNNIYVSVLRYIYNEWNARPENKALKKDYQTFAMILYIIMNLYNSTNFEKGKQIEFELFYDNKCNRLTELINSLQTQELYDTINKRRPRINITSLKFDTHFQYILDYYEKDDILTIRLEVIKSVFHDLKTPYVYDVFDQYISTFYDKDKFLELKNEIKNNLQKSGLIENIKTNKDIKIGKLKGCRRSIFTLKKLAKIKSLSPKCQSFLDLMIVNKTLADFVKKEPKYYNTLMNIYIDVIDSFSFSNFEQTQQTKNTKKIDRRRMLNNIFKLVGLAVAASVPIIAPVAIPVLAGADILSMIGDTFNANTADWISQEVVETS